MDSCKSVLVKRLRFTADLLHASHDRNEAHSAPVPTRTCAFLGISFRVIGTNEFVPCDLQMDGDPSTPSWC